MILLSCSQTDGKKTGSAEDRSEKQYQKYLERMEKKKQKELERLSPSKKNENSSSTEKSGQDNSKNDSSFKKMKVQQLKQFMRQRMCGFGRHQRMKRLKGTFDNE